MYVSKVVFTQNHTQQVRALIGGEDGMSRALNTVFLQGQVVPYSLIQYL